MKKVCFVVCLLCAGFLFLAGTKEIAAADSGSVAINEENFPDVKFRKLIQESMFNRGRDDVLTREEIENATALEIRTEDTLDAGDWDITGIEKLENLQSVTLRLQGVQKGKTITGRAIKGTFQKNAKLTSVVLEADGRKVSKNEIERLFPLKQIKELCIENVDIQELSLSQAAKLKELTVRKCSSLKKIGVSNNKKLEKIIVENTSVRKLNLKKNVNLREVSVQFGYSCVQTDLATGKMGKVVFFKWSKRNCGIQFPKNNNITKLSYFTTDKALDISSCKKLKEIHISKNTKIKVLSRWYQKNKKKLTVYAEGFLQKKLNVQRTKKAVLLKATKVKDVGKGFYCEELDKETES